MDRRRSTEKPSAVLVAFYVLAAIIVLVALLRACTADTGRQVTSHTLPPHPNPPEPVMYPEPPPRSTWIPEW